MCGSKCCNVLNAFISVISTVVSLVGFASMMFYFANYHAAVWSIVSAVFAVCCLHLHVLYLKRKLHSWYTFQHLEGIKSLSLVIFLSSVVALGIYLSLAIVRKQDFSLRSYSYYIAAVFVGVNMYWTFCIFCFAANYQKTIGSSESSETPLLSGVKIHPRSYSE